MTALVEAINVTKRYGDFTALAGVSLAVADNQLVSIIGPNGAGKTTLVNLLTGLMRASSGEVRFKGRDVAGCGPVRLAELGLARGFQLVQIFPDLTIAETIAVAVISRLKQPWRLFSRAGANAAIQSRVKRVAGIFGLERKLDTPARLLSQGEKKLLDVASAFALEPEVILLDEPTSGVASADKHGIMRTLIAAAKEAGVKAIILVEHDMDLVAEYSDRIVALRAGRVLADQPAADFFRNDEAVAAVVGRSPKGAFHARH